MISHAVTVSAEPLTSQTDEAFEVGDVLVDPNDGTPFQLLALEPHDESDDKESTYTVKNLATGEKTTAADTIDSPHDLTDFLVIPDEAIDSPEHIVDEYVHHHLLTDLQTLGRAHDHSVGGSIAAIEFAVWARSQDTLGLEDV